MLCPICGSTKYEEVKSNNGIMGPGGYSWIKYYICKGCSVIFKDLDKFTVKPYTK